jgi:hypothetical protein
LGDCTPQFWQKNEVFVFVFDMMKAKINESSVVNAAIYQQGIFS